MKHHFNSWLCSVILLALIPMGASSQTLPVVEFDFFMEEVSEGVDSVVVEVIITEPDTAEVRAYVINEVSSNALIGTDFEMESPLELIFPPNSTESQFFTISITDDDQIEPLEMIMLAIESVDGGSAITGTEAEHVVAIIDNDSCLVEILNTDTSACTDGSPIALEAIPAGGTFSGAGVIGDMFYPQLCDPGMSMITYTMDLPGCIDSTEHAIKVEVCAGVGKFENPSFSFFPNPANDKVIIEAPAKGIATISNGAGKVVFSNEIAGKHVVGLDGFAPGVYNISVTSNNGFSSSKLMITK